MRTASDVPFALTVAAPAKLNLGLEVLGRRADGYHDLATIFLTVSLFDEVSVASTPGTSLGLECYGSDLPPQENLVWRAAEAMQRAVPERGALLKLEKRIPVAAGLGGASSDAAATLLALSDLWQAEVTGGALAAMALGLGSDVPFLLHGGNAIGGGRGETISPILARGGYHWVFATAAEGLSTAAVYAEFDRLNPNGVLEPEVPDALLNALRAGDAHLLGKTLTNDLTDAALSLRPELGDTLKVGLEAGALGALISGSGPTTLFLVASEEHGLDVSMALASVASSADVIQSRGPVTGARLI